MIILCPIQKRVSVFNRLKSEEEECGGARDDNSNLRNEFEDRECGLEDLGGNLDDEVFNEERRLARSKRFQEGKGNTRMFGRAVMQLGGHSGKYLLKSIPTPEIKGAYFTCYVYDRKRGAASLGRGLPGVRYRQDGRSGTQVFRRSHPQKESQEVRIR